MRFGVSRLAWCRWIKAGRDGLGVTTIPERDKASVELPPEGGVGRTNTAPNAPGGRYRFGSPPIPPEGM